MSVYKIAVLGDQFVGKTNIVSRFVHNIYTDKYDPTIEDSYRICHTINDTEYFCEILDSTGSEQFTSLLNDHINYCDGFILVYSVASKISINRLNDIIESIIDIKKTDRYLFDIHNKKIPCILVGNKNDIDQNKFHHIVTHIKEKHKIYSTKCSAKSNINISPIFDYVISRIIIDNANVEKSKKKCHIF